MTFTLTDIDLERYFIVQVKNADGEFVVLRLSVAASPMLVKVEPGEKLPPGQCSHGALSSIDKQPPVGHCFKGLTSPSSSPDQASSAAMVRARQSHLPRPHSICGTPRSSQWISKQTLVSGDDPQVKDPAYSTMKDVHTQMGWSLGSGQPSVSFRHTSADDTHVERKISEQPHASIPPELPPKPPHFQVLPRSGSCYGKMEGHTNDTSTTSHNLEQLAQPDGDGREQGDLYEKMLPLDVEDEKEQMRQRLESAQEAASNWQRKFEQREKECSVFRAELGKLVRQSIADMQPLQAPTECSAMLDSTLERLLEQLTVRLTKTIKEATQQAIEAQLEGMVKKVLQTCSSQPAR